jgi:hypothetical protein
VNAGRSGLIDNSDVRVDNATTSSPSERDDRIAPMDEGNVMLSDNYTSPSDDNYPVSPSDQKEPISSWRPRRGTSFVGVLSFPAAPPGGEGAEHDPFCRR